MIFRHAPWFRTRFPVFPISSHSQDITTVVTDILSMPFTIKMRMGIQDSSPNAIKIVESIRSWRNVPVVTVRSILLAGWLVCLFYCFTAHAKSA